MGFACLDLINSEQWDGFGRRTDHLEDPTWVKRFLTEWGFEAGLVLEQLDLNRLVDLRTLLRRIVEDIAGHGQPSDEDIAALNAVLSAEPVCRRLVRQDDSYRWNWCRLLSTNIRSWRKLPPHWPNC